MAISSPVLQGLKKAFKDRSYNNIAFCPYALHEELKDKFNFLKNDDSILYKLLIGLPFI